MVRVGRARGVWRGTVGELVEAQRALAAARPEPWRAPPGPLAIGGCVVAFPRGRSGRGAAGDPGWAAAAVVRDGEVIGEAVVAGAAAAPHEPGLLALREGPLLEAAVRALDAPPDVLLVDATGRDHPRRAGLALHLGAVLDLPTVGVTHRALVSEDAVAWVHTRPTRRPLAVHAAWRTDVDTAVEVVLAATGRYRTPEPLRLARRLARLARAR